MRLVKIFFKSFLSLFAIMRLLNIQTRNPISMILFIVFLYVYAKLQEEKVLSRIHTKDPWLSISLSTLFSVFTLAASYQVILSDVTSMLFRAAIVFLATAGLLIIYYHLMIWLLQISERVHITGSVYQSSWLPYAAAGCCFVCWLPYFLYEYPGVMTPDSINQYAQIIGAYELSNHHSILHTMIIGMFYQWGLQLTGDVYLGLALYTLAQMLFMAFVAGYVVKTLQKAKVITPVLVIIIAFYALMPYNGAYAVTIWKDIPFAGAMTVFCATLLRFFLRPNSIRLSGGLPLYGKQKLKISEYFTLALPYIFSGILLCLLRTNGWYAFFVSLPFILFIYRRNWRTMFPMHFIILAVVLFIKYPCMNVYEIKQADFVESLSIPVQQIACVIARNEALSENEWNFVSNLMDITQVSSLYQPDVSDNIKNLIRQSGNDYLETHKSEFFTNWFAIGVSHPGAYFDAYVAQTKGYWYPDTAYEVGLADGIYPNEFGLNWQPILSGSVIIKIKEILFKLHDLIPLYGALWSMGLMFWILLTAAAISLRSASSANTLVLLPIIILVLTLCAATPVATEFRYVYALFYGLPIFLTAPFIHPDDMF